MKKTFVLLLTLLGLVMTAPAAIVQTTSGDTRAKAYQFDWDDAQLQAGTTAGNTKWYDVDLDRVLAMSQPTLALYVTNISSTQTAHVKADVFAGESTSSLGSFEFDLAPGQFRIMSQNASVVKSMSYTSLYIRLIVSNTTDNVALAAKVYETKRIDRSCQKNSLLTINGSSLNGRADSTQWYNFSLDGYKSGKDVNVVITNTGSAEATIETLSSFDCPCTSATNGNATVAAGASTTIVLPVEVLQTIDEDHAYVSVRTTQPFSIKVESETATAPTVAIPSATAYDWTADGMTLGATTQQWYTVEFDSLTHDLYVPSITLRASSAAGATVQTQLAVVSNGNFVVLHNFDWSLSSSRVDFALDVNDLMALKKSFANKNKVVYFGITTSDAELKWSLKNNSVSTNSDCLSATTFDLSGQAINVNGRSLYSEWFTVDMTGFKGQNKDLVVTVENKENKSVTLYSMPATCAQADIDRGQLRTRTLAAMGADGDRISYTVHASLIEGQSDLVYVYVESDGYCVVNVEAVDAEAYTEDPNACTTATAYDWRYGNTQTAADAWYTLSLDSLRNNPLAIPEFYISNNGTAHTEVTVELSTECPITHTPQLLGTYTVMAGDDFARTIARGIFDNMAETTTECYLHVIADQPIFFQIRLSEDNQFASKLCESALDFNWVGGNTQGADSTFWYKVDMSYVKPEKKLVKLHIDNLGSATAHVTGDIAFECPYTSLTSYEATIAAGATKPADGSTNGVISYSMYENLDYVYVRIFSDQKAHVWAEVVDDEIEPITACNTATRLSLDQEYTLNADLDTAWYYFLTEELKNYPDTTFVPQVTVKNNASTAVTATMEMAFHCPVTSTMMTRTVTIGAGGTAIKNLERDMVDNYINDYDTIFVRLISKELTMSSKMIDPNMGEDCLHAINFVYGTEGHNQIATDIWYKVDLQAAHGKKVVAGIKNLEAAAQTVKVGVYTSCDADAVEESARTIGGNGDVNREIGELISGMNLSYMYLRVSSAAAINVYAYFDGDLETGADIDVCDAEQLTKVEPNVHYQQGMSTVDTGVWYYVDIAGLDSTTTGDAVMTITPLAATPVHIASELYWECQTNALPSTKEMDLTTDEYSHTFTREMLEAISSGAAYVRIFASDSIDFVFTINSLKGASCDEAIEFDWEYCNTHPAGTTMWYHINVDTLTNNPDKDLQLTIENLESAVTTVTIDSVRLTCGEEPIMTINPKTLEAEEVKHQIVDNSLLQDLNINTTGIYMKVTSTGQVRICPELIDALQDSVVMDTVYMTVCRGGDFIDPFFENTPDSVDLHNHTTYLIEEDIILSDTVSFRYEGTFHGDSIRWYEIHVLNSPVFPQPMDSSYLPALVRDPGMALDADFRASVLAQLVDSINAQEYVTPYSATETQAFFGEDALWEIGTWNETEQKYNFVDGDMLSDTLTSPFVNEMNNSEMGIRLSYVDSCGFLAVDTMIVRFTDNRCEQPATTVVDTVCPGSEFVDPISGITYTINRDTVVCDTVIYVNATGDQKCDSIVNYSFRVYSSVYSPLDETDYPTVQAGYAPDVQAAETLIRANFEADNNGLAPAIISVAWSYAEDSKDSVFVDITTLSSTRMQKAFIALDMLTDCGNIQDTLEVVALAADTMMLSVEAHICYGDSLESRDGRYHVADVAEQTWADTIYSVLPEGVTDHYVDSIYTYTLTTLVPVDSVADVTLCYGETYEWFGNVYDADQVELHDTLLTVDGCDSIYGVLTLTIRPEILGTDSITLCAGEEYMWNDTVLTYAEAGLYTELRVLESLECGCDSTVTMQVLVGAVTDSLIYDTLCINSTLDLGLNGGLTTITADGQYVEQWQSVLGCDSIITHNVIVRTALTLPDALEAQPQLVCGEAPLLDSINAELETYLASIISETSEQLDTLKWEIKEGEEWLSVDSVGAVYEAGTTREIRYVVSGSCGSLLESEAMEVEVEKPSTDNIYSMLEIPALSKYDNWLLLINYNDITAALDSMGYPAPTAEQVIWYYDINATGVDALGFDGLPIGDDVEVGRGFYYTDDRALTGDYYAVIVLDSIEGDECGMALRTDIINCGTIVNAAPQINPTILNAGEVIVISNLQSGMNTQIEIFDNMGKRVDAFEVSGSSTYEYTTPLGYTGYFLMNITSDADSRALKYIAK